MLKYFFNRINSYLLKEFIKIFLLILFSVFLLVFIIDFMEFSQNIQRYDINPFDAIKIVLFRIPSMIESFLQFIILLSTVFTIVKIAIKSELTVLYSNNFSSWKILKLYSIFVFFIGIFVIFFLNFLFSDLLKKSVIIENSYIRKDNKYFLESSNGIWFKQISEKNEEVIIRASKVYLNELMFKDLIVIFTDDNGNYIKRYNVDSAVLANNYFIFNDVNIYEKNSKIVFKDRILLRTDISRSFMRKLIQNRYEDIDLIPLFNLHFLIKEFSNLGLDTKKFVVKEHSLLLTPFLYVLMVFVAVFFVNNNNRSTNYFITVFKTICYGIVFFILQNTLFEFGATNKINFILSTWGFLFFSFLLFFILLIKKIELVNLN